MAPTSNTTTTTTTSKSISPQATNSDTSTTTTLHLSANFAADEHKSSPIESPGSIGYDHEVFLQLTTAGGDRAVEKTPNQVYQEERAQHRRSRALDPAISDPQGDPSPIDFECAEISQLKSSGPESRSRGS